MPIAPGVSVINTAAESSPYNHRVVLGSLVEAGVPTETAVSRADRLSRLVDVLRPPTVTTDAIRRALDELAHGADDTIVRDILAGGSVHDDDDDDDDGTPARSRWNVTNSKPCAVTAAKKQVVYSRGNNDEDEMLDQKKAGGTFVYETGQFDITASTGTQTCECDGSGDCTGDINVDVHCVITLFDNGFSAVGYSLIPGPAPSTPTTSGPGGPPFPDLSVTVDPTAKLPKAKPENKFKQPKAANQVYDADASTTVSCAAGTSNQRFYIISSNTVAGNPGGVNLAQTFPLCFIDVTIVVTKTANCTLAVALTVYLIEFIPDFDFTHKGTCKGADKELPPLSTTGPDGPPPKKGTTRNIAKLITEDGKKIDNPYPKKI